MSSGKTIVPQTSLKDSDRKQRDIVIWVKLYTKDLLSWAAYKTSDKTLAEDLVQDVFLAAAEKYSSFRNDSQPKTWLFAILNNKIAEHYRKLSSHPKVEPLGEQFFNEEGKWKEDAKPQEWAAEDDNNLLDNPEFNVVLHQCIQELPELQAACIRMKFINGMESEEVCQELNISASNYWQLIHRAKLQLRSCLEKLWFKK